MNSLQESLAPSEGPGALSTVYSRVRHTTTELCDSLEPEDYVVQSMPDISPTKWHLAHTTWFFENFILAEHAQAYRRFNEQYHYLFNSYYYTVGQMHRRPERGLLSRPTVKEIMAYRRYVDESMLALLDERPGDSELSFLVELGLNHEQQHQELILTDIKHVFSRNPLLPALARTPRALSSRPDEIRFEPQRGGVHEIGATAGSFCFDNETPRHRVLIQDFALASRLVTNGEYLEFVRDAGYETSALWLSDGWTEVQTEAWNRPLYWDEACEKEFTLGGERPLDLHAPVCHVSFYEADAFARWAGARLPREEEWEVVAAESPVRGNFQEAGFLHPISLQSASDGGSHQIFGDVWEWAQSPYSPYAGFQPLAGSLGEYNGKFMCNQLVLRGGSCATPQDHIRASYRNFFYPDARWQFSGIRLAKDL